MAANSVFEPVGSKGKLLGFENMLRKENRLWWGTRRWWMQALLWLVILNGFIFLILFLLPVMAPGEIDDGGVPNGVEILFNTGVMLLSLGAIVLNQGVIVDEKLSGTGEWVLSKPLTRQAFLLAKLAGNFMGILVVLVGLQSLAAYLQVWLKTGEHFPVGPFLFGVAILALHVLFYVTLTMLIGVFANNRGIVLAIPLGFLLAGGVIMNFIGEVAFFTPWPVGTVLPLLVQGVELPAMAYLPLIMTPVWTLVFILVSLWKFERVEF
jgi:ABC-2 type transport system permease protein